MKKLLIFTSLIGAAALIFHFYFQNVGRVRTRVNEIFITSADIPGPFEGARIVQISDLFIRGEECIKLLGDVVTQVNILDPEIIVFTGNLFLPDGLSYQAEVVELLGSLDSSLASIAVLGYHDKKNAETVANNLRESGFTVLINDAIQIFNQSPIGINFIGANPLNDSQTMEKLLDAHVMDTRFNIVLKSVPTFATLAFGHNVHVQFSGHCLATRVTSSIHDPCFQFYDGLYNFADAFILNVSTGLARFYNAAGFFRQPVVDSFLLFRKPE